MEQGIAGGSEYLGQMETAKGCGVPHREDELQQLVNEQKRLESRLEEVRLGQEILRKNPDLVKLLKILGGRRF